MSGVLRVRGIRWQRQRRGGIGQGRSPEAFGRRIPAFLRVLDLPDGEVDVLDRRFGGNRVTATADRLVVRRQLLEQDPE
jgi:hypothetical protein